MVQQCGKWAALLQLGVSGERAGIGSMQGADVEGIEVYTYVVGLVGPTKVKSRQDWRRPQ